MLLIMRFVRRAPADSVAALERTDRWAMLLELALLIAFVISLSAPWRPRLSAASTASC